MGGRLPLTMRGAPIGSWGSAGRARRGHWDGQFLDPEHCRKRPAGSHRQPCPGLAALPPAQRKNLVSANTLAAWAIPVGGFAQIAARRMNLSEGQRD
jgi:hypothetical protein